MPVTNFPKYPSYHCKTFWSLIGSYALIKKNFSFEVSPHRTNDSN
ncbi:hypothetical protein LEP1GSC050_3710 [Leptospira broomii serovar Hurstbridge str. 5399]|uniref:Uncharacterized protein n=1 Tax=Leptospira broomii serovar Hurstbridge str. 5399 TaxID=1049789 RepID=T0GGY1_9LEPT|nr:hypothetical protein LEP1GSC050_3710 [Leptospira broomii serovar Hurstbridge str. 5399]